jgi:EcsC protein family
MTEMTEISEEARAHEAKQIAEIKGWEASGNSFARRALAVLTHPAGWIFRKVVPPGAIQGALHGNMWLAERWADQSSVLRDTQAERFSDLANFDLSRLDRVANNVHDWAVAYGGGVGLANGVGGLFAAPLGIPGIINIATRTIRKIGLCYGYDDLSETEKVFIFQTLALAGASGPAEKAAALLALRELQVMIAKQAFKAMAARAAESSLSKEAFIIMLRQFGKQIGVQLTRNRLLMAVPIVGGGVGLLVDGNYIRTVGWTARRVYQKRWLQDRGRWPDLKAGPTIDAEVEA